MNVYDFFLLQKVIGTLYLDNTYLNVNITEFPTREESLEKTVNLIKSSNPNQLFAISVNNIGREKFIHELAKSLQVHFSSFLIISIFRVFSQGISCFIKKHKIIQKRLLLASHIITGLS